MSGRTCRSAHSSAPRKTYADLAGFSDFIRPALYNNVAGGRFVSFVKDARKSVFGDLPPETTLDVLYRQFNYNEAPYDKLAATGFSADYVERETRRAVEGRGRSSGANLAGRGH